FDGGPGSGGFAIVGDADLGALGQSAAGAGDVNGDNLDDVIVGAPGETPGGSFSGAAYVVFGRSDTSTVATGALGAEGFRIDGDTGFIAGRSVDGIGDV